MKKLVKISSLILLLPIVLIILLLAYSIINDKVQSKNDLVNHPAPGNLIDIDGTMIHLYATGEKKDGLPTIVLEAGGGMCSADWQLIQPEVSKINRTCSWDRPGYGWSENTKYERTSKKAAIELHEALVKNGENPPFLLVGHSVGGHTMRIFNCLFPDEVAGLILLDARPSDMLEIPILKEIGSGQSGKLELFTFLSKTGITRLIGKNMIPASFQEKLPSYPYQICYKPKYFEANQSEAKNIEKSDKETLECSNLNESPLIVIRHKIPDIFAGLPKEDSLAAENSWINAQNELAQLSTNSQIWIADNSGHNIHIDQPEIVKKAIEKMILAN